MAKKRSPAKSRKKTGSTRFQKGRSGNPAGRKKGVPNKVTVEVREAARLLVEDAEYREKLLTRLRAGKAGKMETLLWHYAYGVPKQTMSFEQGESPVVFTLKIDDPGIGPA